MEGDSDFDTFMEKVDQVENILKELKSSDPEIQQQGIERAGDYLKTEEDAAGDGKIKYDRTIVNKDAYKNDQGDNSVIGPEAFKAQVERDCEERKVQREESQWKADKENEKGNVEFRKGNFRRALVHYNKSLQFVKDKSFLYINRALTYMKMKKYEEAVADCDAALRLKQGILKGQVTKGRILTIMEKYADAIECFNQALLIDPGQKKLIQTYIDEINEIMAIKKADELEESEDED